MSDLDTAKQLAKDLAELLGVLVVVLGREALAKSLRDVADQMEDPTSVWARIEGASR